jgi:hypothetical protein
VHEVGFITCIYRDIESIKHKSSLFVNLAPNISCFITKVAKKVQARIPASKLIWDQNNKCIMHALCTYFHCSHLHQSLGYTDSVPINTLPFHYNHWGSSVSYLLRWWQQKRLPVHPHHHCRETETSGQGP